MMIVFFVLAGIGTILLLFYITIELNSLEKKVGELTKIVGEHYESQ